MQRERSTGIPAVVVILLALLMGTPGWALLVDGDPIDGNSWSQGWIADSADRQAVQLEWHWLSGSKGAGPNYIWGFSNASWSRALGTPTLSVARGLALTADMTFSMAYVDPKSSPTQWDFRAWDASSNLLERVTATWNGSSWSLVANPTPVGAPAAVPEPASLALLACAVGSLGLGLKRRKRT